MTRSAFQRWMGRIGLAAMLLLLVVPTTGRVVHAQMPMEPAAGDAGHEGGHSEHVAHHAQHGHHAHHVHHGGQDRDEGRAAIGDPDCEYCPLLASLVASAAIAFDASRHAPHIAAAAVLRSPRLRWRHPFGLGSRGPPRAG